VEAFEKNFGPVPQDDLGCKWIRDSIEHEVRLETDSAYARWQKAKEKEENLFREAIQSLNLDRSCMYFDFEDTSKWKDISLNLKLKYEKAKSQATKLKTKIEGFSADFPDMIDGDHLSIKAEADRHFFEIATEFYNTLRISAHEPLIELLLNLGREKAYAIRGLDDRIEEGFDIEPQEYDYEDKLTFYQLCRHFRILSILYENLDEVFEVFKKIYNNQFSSEVNILHTLDVYREDIQKKANELIGYWKAKTIYIRAISSGCKERQAKAAFERECRVGYLYETIIKYGQKEGDHYLISRRKWRKACRKLFGHLDDNWSQKIQPYRIECQKRISEKIGKNAKIRIK
jgi:hypothetical protein